MPTSGSATQSPALAKSGHIHRLARPRVTRKMVLELARGYGLKGNMKTGSLFEDAYQTSYSEGPLQLVVHHASGGLRFCDRDRWQVDDGTSHVEFDDKTAIAMAERFIGMRSVVPLAECRVSRVSRLNVAVAEMRAGTGDHRVIDAGVIFARVVRDVPVEGPGGKVIVYIDSKGNLTGIDRVWREIEPGALELVELRSPDDARDEAIRDWGDPGSGSIAVDYVRFGYYEHGFDVAQRYLQPAYVVSMTLTNSRGHFSGAVVRSEYLAAAAVKSPEPLMPRRSDVPAQSPRQRYASTSS